ncbi:MAG: RadC family protein [Bacteroidota bacterium]
MDFSLNTRAITSWSQEDRPREKFLLKGKSALSDAELMAILIGSGTRKESAVELCRKIMTAAGNDLHQLGKFTLQDFKKFKGIGVAKALTIASALELGRRRSDNSPTELKRIKCSKDAYDLMRPKFIDLPHEEFHVVYLNRSAGVIKQQMLSSGGTKGTVVDVKIIIKNGIEVLASSILLFHNHPGGSSNPSKEDIAVTKKIVEAARLFDMSVSDHIIIYENKYTSFADEGLL